MFQKLHYILLPLLCIAGFANVACSDDEEFTTDFSAHLKFSTDTISFDTVFTTIGSSTQRFKVYNPNSKGIKLTSVHLASGGNSGFRINVDGHYGTSVSDIEVLHNDSIFVFVEVTIDPLSSDTPILVRDSVVFLLESGLRQHVVLEACGQDVIKMKGKTIHENMELSPSRPYLIYDSLVVAPDATLRIPAGTRLCFHNGANMIIHGQIICSGDYENPIIFRGDRTDKLFPYLPYDRMDAQWGGITISPESFENVFDHVDIHSGTYGILCDSSATDRRKLELTNSIIHNVSTNGLLSVCNDIFVANTQISNSGRHCVALYGGMAEFIHCTIAQFYPWNASHGGALYFCNAVGDFLYPLEKAYFFNSIITGSSNDDISGGNINLNTDKPSSLPNIPFNYSFENCVLNTLIDEKDAESYVNCILESADNEVYKTSNFRNIDTGNYIYDFRLNESSIARGVGNASFSSAYPADMLGVPRPIEHPDAGCYQYE